MRGSLAIAGAACLWGLWSLFYRSAEHAARATPVSAAAESFVVLGVMLVALLPRAVHDATRAPRRSPRAWAALAFAGLLDGGNFLCFLAAMQKTTVTIAVLTHYLAPLVVAALAPVVLRERWRLGTFGATLVAVAGLALLLRPWAQTLSAGDVTGALFGAASALCYGGSVVVQKGLAARFSPFELGAFSKPPALAVSALALGSASALALELEPLAWLVAGGVLCGAIPLVLFFTGLRRTAASRAAVLTLCEPVVAMAVGALVWREPLGWWSAAGSALILGAAAWIARGEGGAQPTPRRAVG